MIHFLYYFSTFHLKPQSISSKLLCIFNSLEIPSSLHNSLELSAKVHYINFLNYAKKNIFLSYSLTSSLMPYKAMFNHLQKGTENVLKLAVNLPLYRDLEKSEIHFGKNLRTPLVSYITNFAILNQ